MDKDVSITVPAANIPIYIWYFTPRTSQINTFLELSIQFINGQVGLKNLTDIIAGNSFSPNMESKHHEYNVDVICFFIFNIWP